VDYYSQPETITTPTHPAGPDPSGLMFRTAKYQTIWGIGSAFPSEPALSECRQAAAAPLLAGYTVRYITYISTSSEGGTSTSLSASKSLSLPHDNTAVQTTIESVRTLVSDGPNGPATTVQTIDVTALATSNAGSNRAIHDILLPVVWFIATLLLTL
jgi:hypothetical protein